MGATGANDLDSSRTSPDSRSDVRPACGRIRTTSEIVWVPTDQKVGGSNPSGCAQVKGALRSCKGAFPLGLLESARAEIRVHGCPPLFKLYILNNDEVFFGFYPIRHHEVKIKGTPHPVFDLMGKEASLFRHTIRDGSPVSAQYVAQAREWFTTVWETISRKYAG